MDCRSIASSNPSGIRDRLAARNSASSCARQRRLNPLCLSQHYTDRRLSRQQARYNVSPLRYRQVVHEIR